jgi:hypothetical protein
MCPARHFVYIPDGRVVGRTKGMIVIVVSNPESIDEIYDTVVGTVTNILNYGL